MASPLSGEQACEPLRLGLEVQGCGTLSLVPMTSAMSYVQAYADENGLAYWETSAKSNTNVTSVFEDIAKKLPQAQTNAPPVATGIQLAEQSSSQPRKSGCCS